MGEIAVDKRSRFGGLFKTSKGKWKLLGLIVLIIVVSSFIAMCLSTDFGKVNVKDIRFDAEGAILDATLYTPLGVNANDKLPAVVIAHGSGVSHGVMAGTAEELARRGFVVLNVSAYGSGSSENSDTVESGKRGGFDTPQGVYDAVLYLRTLKYVDQTRIGITGHSMGGRRITAAAVLDGSYLSLNDMMINTLHDTFGQQFTKDEINIDADMLAKQRLSEDQLPWYNQLKKESEDYLSVRIKGVLNLGDATTDFFAPRKVTVGGHEVIRTPQVNGGFLIGIYNEGTAGPAIKNESSDKLREIYQTGDTNIVRDIWYQIHPYTSDATPSSEKIGNVWETSVLSSQALADAINNRSARIFFAPADHHSQDFLSPEATSDVVKFFEQTMSYNNGELTDKNTVPLDSKNSIFLLREILNGIAMIALILALIALASILLDTAFFKACKLNVAEPVCEKRSKPFWIISAIIFAFSCWAIAWVGSNGLKFRFTSTFFSLDFTVNIIIAYLIFVAAASLIVLAAYKLISGKKAEIKYLETFNIRMKFGTFAKTLLLSYILFLAAYISMSILKFMFNEDYRFWMAVMTKMNPQNFMLMLRYGLVIFPTFLLSGIIINFGRMKDMSEGKNTALNVILACLPVYLVAIVSYGVMYLGANNYTPLYAFVTTWTLLITIPLTAYISRKMYKFTGSIWLGTFLNTFLVTWMFCSSLSSSELYLIGNFFTKWLGIG
ncbi:serine aminopeptidase S33 family [Anaerobacterium chartisolvens]|uniref:Serine aminopeptidase S33 family n=1 Tax=Anaerobacterium chartisolvens TaxID=1297424 RepID=A0A369ADA7_9FIRM|nr:alpha/beta hydrolase [Anaerobacterium chartisolvens]RCX07350.1 serine aminopeptidase S33 family [Anaerobacterium chartisolvens]